MLTQAKKGFSPVENLLCSLWSRELAEGLELHSHPQASLNGSFQPAVCAEKWEGAKTRVDKHINTMCKQ